METTKQEIATISERNLKLNLSDADIKRISDTAGRVGLTVTELLQNFIGDLVHGTYTNGSDERMYANQWFDRCWFSMDFIYENSTFLRFLLGYNGYDIGDAIANWKDINEYKNSDDEDEREIYAESQESLTEIFTDFLNQLADMHQKPTLEEAMTEVIKWHDEYQQLKGGGLNGMQTISTT